jgi:hypothetical protein
MSTITSITQSSEIAVIYGAYYEVFGEQHEAKYYRQFSWTFKTPLAIANPSLEDSEKFKRLIAEWHRERRVVSLVTDMAMCPSYQKIIAMGEVAIPLILSELRTEGDEPDHWFWALRVLTEADPVGESDRGDIIRMAAAWLDWGQSHGYGR